MRYGRYDRSSKLTGGLESKTAATSDRDGETVMTEFPKDLTVLLSRHTRRRGFIAGLGSAVAWPLAVGARRELISPTLTRLRGECQLRSME
jgi:hypothetical protein